MPRPGPRPYECVRRAWHSDTHQPIRGSIIQQVLRVVHESHSSSTKQNREWQEKLPVVVLKVEEIIYSKANSETEYIDAETLWERVNDAIDTIIRRDETTETGDLLPPCVEAALNLGCVPIRTSRSERNAQQRNYLYTGGVVHDEAVDRMNQFTIIRPAVANQTLPNRSSSTSFYLPTIREEEAPSSSNNQFAINSLGSVYPPHYYGQTFCRQTLLSKPECAKMGCLQNLFPHEEIDDKGVVLTNKNKHNETPDEMTCDLSLRLGFFSGK
ncbi:uncharacterized protein LOC124911327 [Impatiens glandulifera]|uniref:uncharacterized protein LOC124911327 n=1 Tax=Impatiens glandulifera TaxID=253017 RepID=UPI001FB09450|nr:uncharacterized protein LOC124911327 [Impatiens glandulifera]